MPIEHISDTARWVAVYRAMETDRPDALFRDPYARRLAGERGEEIVNTMRRGRATAWAMIVRTQVLDEMILDAISNRGIGQVVNLAAGLDTRPWRLALPSALQWIDVDLPGILNYKQEELRDATPVCSYRAITADLTDAVVRASVLAEVSAGGIDALVITEGLLVYLTGEQVGGLATALHETSVVKLWLTDLAGPRLLQIMNKYWGREARAGSAPFQFAPAEGTAFFEPFGWRESSFRSAIEEARRLNREMNYMWLYRILSVLSTARRREEIRRMSGMVMLERKP